MKQHDLEFDNPSRSEPAISLTWSTRSYVARQQPSDAPDSQHPSWSAQDLFDALDDRFVTLSDRRWRLEVFSIVDDEDVRWLQLALRGVPRYTLLLRLSPVQGPLHVRQILSSWLAKPSRRAVLLNAA